MDTIFVQNFAIVLFFFSVLNGAVYFAWLWQLKEYRWDRMMDMMSLKSGRKKISPHFILFKGFFVIAGAIFIFANQGFAAEILLLSSLLADPVDAIIRFRRKRLFRPDKTIKAILIVSLAMLISTLFAAYFNFQLFFLALISFFIGDVVTVIVFFINPITSFFKKNLIKKAKRKISERADLTVIGITGSYGKSSCKEFLYKILEQKFSVLKTPGNTNSDIGVAQIVLKNLNANHQVFICEMGAYKKGEILKICEIVKPDFGIVTAIKNCHLSLFGSEKKLLEAKSELVESLNENGVAIIGIDTPLSLSLFEKCKKKALKKRIGYSLFETNTICDFSPKEIIVMKEQIKFHFNNKSYRVNLYGIQNLANLIPAILIAEELGLNDNEIRKGIFEITQPPRTMTLKKISSFLSIIDDSYNTNPDGTVAALNYLELYDKSLKVIVFPGMLELGDNSFSEHQRVGKKIAEICDLAIFTSDDFEEPLRKGIEQAEKEKIIKKGFDYAFLSDSAIANDILKAKMSKHKKTAILFESRGGEQIMNEIKKTQKIK